MMRVMIPFLLFSVRRPVGRTGSTTQQKVTTIEDTEEGRSISGKFLSRIISVYRRIAIATGFAKGSG